MVQVERVIQFEGPENIAAILMEGESGSSGCIKYPPGYWKGIKKIADKHDILIISDEVMSGFGRCGKWFAIENHNVVPDIIVTAKGLHQNSPNRSLLQATINPTTKYWTRTIGRNNDILTLA